MKRFLVVAALAVGLAMPAWGQDFQKGLDAYNGGDFLSALQEWRPLAEQGDANVQAKLGVMYASGEGVPQDYAEAARWYRLAAERGNAVAQYNLGVMYAEGEGVLRNYVQAHKWFNLVATRRGMHRHQDEARNNRDIIAERMTRDQIAEAQRLAREWRPKAE